MSPSRVPRSRYRDDICGQQRTVSDGRKPRRQASQFPSDCCISMEATTSQCMVALAPLPGSSLARGLKGDPGSASVQLLAWSRPPELSPPHHGHAPRHLAAGPLQHSSLFPQNPFPLLHLFQGPTRSCPVSRLCYVDGL